MKVMRVPPAVRQGSAAILAATVVLAIIVASPPTALLALSLLGPVATLILIVLVLWLAPRRRTGNRGELHVWGWLTFVCGVVASAFFVVHAVGAARMGVSDSTGNTALNLIAAGCWWPGGIVALVIWALEEW